MPRASDSELIALGAREQRIVLTEDKDFGWRVFASHAESAGVVLIRFPGNARETLARTVAQLVLEHSKTLTGAFVVVQPGYVRISKKLA